MATLECSSKGDNRFSALYARVYLFDKWDTIENWYQLCKRFNGKAPSTFKEAKGKRPSFLMINRQRIDKDYLTQWYKYLWLEYLDRNPHLVEYASEFNKFNDHFRTKSTINCQADVIEQYVQEGRMSLVRECQELTTKLYN